jgi:hypothetical protein
MTTVRSINGIEIRLTSERWSHIEEEHGEIAGMQHETLETVGAPDRVLAGNAGECLAVRRTSETKFLVVVYKEDTEAGDGFVITAFVTSRTRSLDGRRQIWP